MTNLLQNFNTSDLFSLGLGITLFSYSMYCLITQTIPLGYKTIPLFSSDSVKNTQSELSSKSTTTSSSFNETVNNSSSSSEAQYFTNEPGINTEGTNLVDSAVQTDTDMLYDYLRELLYNDATPKTSLGEISPTDFVRDYRNDPELASYFNRTAEWAESISRTSSGTSANSEVLFMRKVTEDLRSITDLIKNNLSSLNNGADNLCSELYPYTNITDPNSPAAKILATHNTELYPSYDGWLKEIYDKILNHQSKITDIEQLRNLIDLYHIVPNEIYNVDYVSTLIIYGSI